MPRLFISAAHKSSGKTTVTLGLCAAFLSRGSTVRAFKKGPDYIDPLWLSRASGQPCYNLDFYTMDQQEILAKVASNSTPRDITLIEGNKGLYDGLDLDGSNSNAALAKLLNTPVVLVIDARGMTRGIAPLILGYQSFDPEIRIAGIILNKLGGSRHEKKLRAVIEHYTGVPVVGAIHRDPRLEIKERHLGLMPSNEVSESDKIIANIGSIISDQVDLELLNEIANSATEPQNLEISSVPGAVGRKLRIGIAKDAAFCFYYPDDIEAMQQAGAELVPVNMLEDTHLPDLDGLFIGGGFPEANMEALEANATLQGEVRDAIQSGLPTYAECGGLMYLARSITWKDRCCQMAGVIPADVVMHERPEGRGYVRLKETADSIWPRTADSTADGEIAAHEFHYSSLTNIQEPLKFAYRVLRGTGTDGQHDGIVINNLLACYTHQRNTGQNNWVPRFVEFVRQHASAGRSGTVN